MRASPVFGFAASAGEQIEPFLLARGEQLIPAAGAPVAALLAARHRPERQIAGPPRQRLGDLTHEEQVGGARQEESSRRALAIDRSLDRAQQSRLALDLVERHRVGAADQRLRIAARRVQHVQSSRVA